MEPFKVKELPIEYNIDKELLKLLSEANEKYGEYKSYLKNIEFDSRFFLDSIILSESLKSTQIEGTQISQDEMYYLKYMPNSDDNLEIQNLKKVIDYSNEYLKNSNHYSKIPISIITGEDSKDMIDKAFKYNIVDMLVKPFSKNDFLRVLDKTINLNKN